MSTVTVMVMVIYHGDQFHSWRKLEYMKRKNTIHGKTLLDKSYWVYLAMAQVDTTLKW
jgi:hypothetical protein